MMNKAFKLIYNFILYIKTNKQTKKKTKFLFNAQSWFFFLYVLVACVLLLRRYYRSKKSANSCIEMRPSLLASAFLINSSISSRVINLYFFDKTARNSSAEILPLSLMSNFLEKNTILKD